MANSPKFCSKCGTAVEEGARVCEACGAKLSGRSSASFEPASRPLAANEPKTEPTLNRQNWKPALIAGGAIVIIGLVVAVCLLAVVMFRLYDPVARIFGQRSTSTPVPVAALSTATFPAVVDMPTQIPETTSEPAATPTTVPTAGQQPNLVYGGVSFHYTPDFTSAINSQTLPANPPSDTAAPWDVAPQHILFEFTGYTLSGTFHNPRMYVYPVEEYIKLEPRAAATIDDLKKLLAEKPQQMGPIPFLPFWNAAQMFHTKVAYLEFHNGSGIRFLTQYGQSIFPVNNNMLFYSFQGLTNDGKYYISAILPVQNAILPPTGDLDQQGFQNLEKNYQVYLADIAAKLDAQPGPIFKPGLDTLDEMIQSLEVK